MATAEPDQAVGSEPATAFAKILSIPVRVKIVLGTTTMPVSSLMKLKPGAVISLDQKVGEKVQVVVNGRTVARGEVVITDEATGSYGVSLVEIVEEDEDAGAA